AGDAGALGLGGGNGGDGGNADADGGDAEGGNVTQFFGNSQTVASGDGSQAAGDDLTNIETDIDIEVGDIWAGNTWNTESFNEDFSDNWSINDSFQDDSVNTDVDVEVENSNVGSPFGDANEFDLF
ncbi:MAG: hypothetical protein WAZ28_12080, partial [Microbacterium sp.]